MVHFSANKTCLWRFSVSRFGAFLPTLKQLSWNNIHCWGHLGFVSWAAGSANAFHLPRIGIHRWLCMGNLSIVLHKGVSVIRRKKSLNGEGGKWGQKMESTFYQAFGQSLCPCGVREGDQKLMERFVRVKGVYQICSFPQISSTY